jgi:hypothetical protein
MFDNFKTLIIVLFQTAKTDNIADIREPINKIYCKFMFCNVHLKYFYNTSADLAKCPSFPSHSLCLSPEIIPMLAGGLSSLSS